MHVSHSTNAYLNFINHVKALERKMKDWWKSSQAAMKSAHD